jgi:hypothetical protein
MLLRSLHTKRDDKHIALARFPQFQLRQCLASTLRRLTIN